MPTGSTPVTKWSTLLATKLGSNSKYRPVTIPKTFSPNATAAAAEAEALPAAARAALHPPATNREVLRHLSALLTRHGARGEPLVAAVQRHLQVRYGVQDPILRAINAVKPVIKYYKSKSNRQFVPLALYPKTANAMALRWIISAASGRTFVGGRPDIVRALGDEIDAILQGTSPLYQKRFNTHRNPN